MIALVDTSVWIEHFRHGKIGLTGRLTDGLVLMHPYVSGELACGNLKDRMTVLLALNTLPSASRATDAEVMHLIEDRGLWGRGLGWIDAHLLASALLSNCQFWTLDKRLERAARELGLN
ncbi:MAG TPA: PIN domain-containing protein [Bryobacteraceae bacterium]|nr:PIN domain-containing protein [Bryobacteraceae bacterium]